LNVIDGLTALVRDLAHESVADVQLNFASEVMGDLPIAIYLIERAAVAATALPL